MVSLEVGCSCFFLLATLISAHPVYGTEFAAGAYALLVYAVMCTVEAWLRAAGLGSAVPDAVIAVEWGLWTSLLLFSTLTFERWHALGRVTSALGVAWVATVTLATMANPSLRGASVVSVLRLWVGLPGATLAAVTYAQVGARLPGRGRQALWAGTLGGASFSALALLNGPLGPLAGLSPIIDRGVTAGALLGVGGACFLLLGPLRSACGFRATHGFTNEDDESSSVATVVERTAAIASRAACLSAVRVGIVAPGGRELRWFGIDASAPLGRWWAEPMTPEHVTQLRELPSAGSPAGRRLSVLVAPLLRPRRQPCFELIDCDAQHCPVRLGGVDDCWRVGGTPCRTRGDNGLPACASCKAFRVAGLIVGVRGRNGRPMTQARMTHFWKVARQAASRLDRALLAEEAAGHVSALRSTSRSLQILKQSARLFASTLDRLQLHELIVEECARAVTSADVVALWLVEESSDRLTLVAGRGAMDRVRGMPSVEDEAVARRALQAGEPQLRAVPAAGPGGASGAPREGAASSCLWVPLKHQDQPVGAVSFVRFDACDAFAGADCDLAKAIGTLAAIALENSELHSDAVHAAATDSLTGLYNHGSFFRRLDEEMAAATRHSRRLSLMMVDLDHFKAYNDRRGHLAGDRAIIALARALQRNLRASDIVCRYGGEEFAVILPGTGLRAAYLLAEKLRVETARHLAAVVGDDLTVSIGVAAFQVGADTMSFVQTADALLYHAKRAGRNRTCILGEEPASECAF